MKHLVIAGTCAATLCLLAACDKEKDYYDVLDAKTYTGFNELTVTYNESPMSGKSVTFTPPAGAPATFKVFSQFDLSQLSGSLKGTPPIQAPGALPGTPELTFTADLYTAAGHYTFSGAGETEFVTYSYDGTVNREKMSLNFTGVKLKDLTFAGKVFAPAPAVKNPDGIGYSQLPFHIVWESDMPVQIPGLTNGIEDLMKLFVTLPIIPAYGGTAEMSLVQVIGNAIKTIGMRDDGCIPVTYLQTANGSSQFTQTPMSFLQYVPTSAGSLRLFVNPTDLLTLVLLNNTNRDPDIPENPFGAPAKKAGNAGNTDNEEMKEIAFEIAITCLEKLAPMLATGIPVTVAPQSNGVAMYIDSEAMLPLMKELTASILANDKLKAMLTQAIIGNPQLVQMLPDLLKAMERLPEFIASTTRIELGLNLVPYK